MSVKSNLENTLKEIEHVVTESGRESGSVQLLAVSKTKPLELLQEAYNSGQRLFGENRVQEAEIKVPQMPDDAVFHMIGHLQSNKVNKACEFFSCIQSVDSLKLANKINNRCNTLNKVMDIYIEVNISNDPNKSGYIVNDSFYSDISEILSMENINVAGLMAIGAHVDNRDTILESFNSLKQLQAELQNKYEKYSATELSMGMSGDFIEAIEAGSTMVRIGSAIFGSRY